MAEKIIGESRQRYELKKISIMDMIHIINRHKDTQYKLCQAYLGYKRALLSLMTQTFFDYEKGSSLVDFLPKHNLDPTETAFQ